MKKRSWPKLFYQPRRVAIICLCCLLCVMILSHNGVFNSIQKAKADTTGNITLIVANNSQILSDSPNTPLGANYPTFSVSYESGTGADHREFLKFDISALNLALNNATINITSASIHLYCYSITNDPYGSINGLNIRSIDPLNESWIDTTLTWNNAPTRNSYYECDSYTVISAVNSWYSWSLTSGNSSQGLGALEQSYYHNTTRTFVLQQAIGTTWIDYFYARNSSISRPYLYIEYNIVQNPEPVEGAPALTSPVTYDMLFYDILDVGVNPSSSSPNTSTNQIMHSIFEDSDNYMYLKFNLSFPNLVEGQINNGSLLLKNRPFDIQEISFRVYCDYVPPEGSGWLGQTTVSGIPRINETWGSSMTWANKPTWRYNGELHSSYTSVYNVWYVFDLISEEDYIRYSVNNDTTYSLVLHVDATKSPQAYSNWRSRDYNYSYFTPCIYMKLTMGNYTFPMEGVTLFNMKKWLALSWWGNLGFEFSAGILLTVVFFMITVVPIGYILRKKSSANKWAYLILISASLGLCTMFTWLPIGLFLVIMIMMLLSGSGVLKRWI